MAKRDYGECVRCLGRFSVTTSSQYQSLIQHSCQHGKPCVTKLVQGVSREGKRVKFKRDVGEWCGECQRQLKARQDFQTRLHAIFEEMRTSGVPGLDAFESLASAVAEIRSVFKNDLYSDDECVDPIFKEVDRIVDDWHRRTTKQ